VKIENPIASNKRGGAKIAAANKYLIEGGYYTSADVATKLEISIHAARTRVRRAKALAGPLTWEKLK